VATSQNLKIQQLMNQVEALDSSDKDLEAKLQQIAEAVAAEQQKMRPKPTAISDKGPVDPQDAFACDGCQ
jgi:hypothetical protein